MARLKRPETNLERDFRAIRVRQAHQEKYHREIIFVQVCHVIARTFFFIFGVRETIFASNAVLSSPHLLCIAFPS